MCLSPEVDIVAGVAISAVAVDALRHVDHRRTLPLAALPAIFAFHTFVSAFVWWGERGDISAALGDAASTTFMFIAFILLPIYVPICIFLLEPPGWRRIALLLITGAGVASGVDYFLGLVGGQGSAVACSYYIDYTIDGRSAVSGVLYLIATCGALLLSGSRPLFLWGIVNAVGVAVLAVWVQAGLPSLWCFWAAITSFFVAWYLRRLRRQHQEGQPWPWEPPPAAEPQPVLTPADAGQPPG